MKSISQPTDGSKADLGIAQVYVDITESTTKAIAELTESDVAIYCDEYRRPGWLLAQLRNHDRAINRTPDSRTVDKNTLYNVQGKTRAPTGNSRQAAKPKQRKRRSTTRRSTSRKSQTAAQVFQSQIADAMAESLDRVNGDETDADYPQSRVIPFVRTTTGKVIMLAV